MPKLGIGSSLTRAGLTKPGIVTDSLVLKHNYAAGGVVPVSDGAAYFDGAGDYIDCGHDATLDVGTSDFTACCWFKLVDDGNDYDIISKGTSLGTGYGWGVSFYDTTSKLYFDCGDNSTRIDTISSTAISHNTWYHIAVTRSNSGNLSQIYINGVLDVTKANTLDDLGDGSQSIPFEIGSSTANRYLNGYICNVGYWSTALTQAQIKSIMWKNYAGLTSSETTGLVSWWNLSADANDNHGSNDGALT